MSVYEKINAIAAELSQSGIAKTQKSSQGYTYRGIDGAQQALSGLLAKHKLCILPRVVSQETTERKKDKGGVLRFSVVSVEYDFVDAENPESKHTCIMVGEGFDSGDKAINKALSNAFKYLCWEAFCIPLEGVGVDSEVDDDSPEPEAPVNEDDRFIQLVGKGMNELGLNSDDLKEALPQIGGRNGVSRSGLLENQDAVLDWLERKKIEHAFDRRS